MAKLALRSNRKFRRLVGMLRMDSPVHVEGHLQALWRATWENGNSLIGDLTDIEALAEWTQMSDRVKYPTGAFASAVVLTGFIDTIVPGELYAVHDWYDHAEAWAKQRVSRAAKEDPTVCAETYFLGLDAWRRRAAELGIDILAGGAVDETDPDLPPDPVENVNGDRNARRLAIRSPKPGDVSRFGHLSSLAEPSQDKPSLGSIPPPRSPSSLFSTGRRPAAPLADPPADLDTGLRAAMGRVTDAVVHLEATDVAADQAAAEQIEDQALACRTLDDWTALADLANEVLQQSAARMGATA